MQAEHIDRTPEWQPGMGEVDGMAAHPSMQRRSTEELYEKLAQYWAELLEARSFPRTRDQRELVKSLRRLISATKLAINWREGRGR